jgi:hypothetical protein
MNDLPNLLSLLAFFSATALIFRSVQFALIVTASLGFHELGHAAALAWYGLESRITFGVVGAWTSSSLPAREKLSHLENTMIHLGGPFFSFLLALAALGLQAAWQPADRHLLILASFSGEVGFLNLIPLGGLTDGGRVLRRMIASLESTRRAPIVLLPILITTLMLAVYFLIEAPHLKGAESSQFLLGLLLLGIWMANSLLLEVRRAARSNLESLDSGKKMRNGEVAFLVLVMWDLLALGLVIIAATPFWLAPEYVMGSLRNIIAVIHLFERVAL